MVTLREVIVATIFLVTVLITSQITSSCLAAFMIGLGATLLLVYMYTRLYGYWNQRILNRWKNPRPVCGNGRCHWQDYETVEIVRDSSGYRGRVLKCRCGIKYVLKSYDLSNTMLFLQLLEDGSVKPYMVFRRGCWVPASSDEIDTLGLTDECMWPPGNAVGAK
jgi:hypothetical protein